jgi:hypothetical protein
MSHQTAVIYKAPNEGQNQALNYDRKIFQGKVLGILTELNNLTANVAFAAKVKPTASVPCARPDPAQALAIPYQFAKPDLNKFKSELNKFLIN